MATAAGDELEKILLSVDNTPLDPDDNLFDVKKALIPVVAEWRAIGEGLRLRGGTLNVINRNHPNDAISCMGAVASEWLNRNYSIDRFGEPTWRKLVEIIGSPMGGNNLNHARKIAQQHPGSKPPSPIRSDTISKEVAALREQVQEQGREMARSQREKQDLVEAVEKIHKLEQQLRTLKSTESDSSSKEVAALREQVQEMARSQREKQELVEAVEKIDKLEQQLRTLKSSTESDSSSKEIAVLQQQLLEQGRKMEELASYQRDKQHQMEVVQKVAELEQELKKLRPPIQSESQKMPEAAAPPPQQPRPLQPMQPKPQWSTGEQKPAISNKLEVVPQDRQQQQKPHPPASQKSPTEKPHPPSGQKLPPIKRESVDERSIPQQKKKQHQSPPLPEKFSQLNGREAILSSITISDGEATAVSENLRVNKTLETLMLRWVNVSDVGFTTLAEAMRDNQSLTTLQLRFESVSDGGARDFAKKMEGWGPSLKTLRIYYTSNIGADVKQMLRETARRKGINLTLYDTYF